jgi:FemAB-related protein (PEP-CTERM system-associated)
MDTRGVAIRAFQDSDAQAWSRFVCEQPQATVFHQLQWSQCVESAYGHRPLHQMAWQDDRLVGILPLFLVKSMFVGRVLVSVPYATYGGILAGTDDAAQSLLVGAQSLALENRAAYLELRHRDANGLELTPVGAYDTFRKQLPEDPDEVLGGLPKKARAAARHGLGELTVETGPDLLGEVYSLYARTMRRLGSPNYRKGLFQQLSQAYGDDAVCLVVRHGRKAVAGVISFIFRDEIVPYFSGSTALGRAMGASNVMYLKLMEYAVTRGLKTFDFNRTRRDNQGPHAFKRHMGFEPTPLHYQISLNTADRPPELTPSNRKFALAGKVWRRLPLCMTRPMSSIVTKWVP